MTLKVIQGHIRPHLCQNHSSTFVYGPILMKICMNVNIIKLYMTYNLLYNFVISLRPFDLNITFELRSYGQLLSLFYFNVNIDINSHDIYFKHRYADLVW